MYLKRVEIQGFKSFASKSAFEFGPGVTAVVGPNGSGKSNLADALRWVLGEQNPRELRSRKSEEVIFAGGRQRAPAGFAEVSMSLDNASGWLPLEFDEVVFTRRLHRSGESEYLVNGARVRLKDVLDLLSRARAGQNSYAIMGQGLVDSVLNLPPEERRRLIEEAADVNRHRMKIQDAVGRLAATRDNLDRVALLVGEIGPRLVQLEAQARKAAEYQALTADLGESLRVLFAAQWGERTTALAAAREAYEQRMNALIDAQREVEQIEVELNARRIELQQLRDAAGIGESIVRELDDRLRRGGQHVELLQERQTLLSTRKQEVTAEIDALSAELEVLACDGAAESDLAGDEAALNAAVDEQAAELEALESTLEAAQRSLTDAEGTLRSARGRVGTFEDRAARLQHGLRNLEREKDEAASRRNSMLARLRALGRDALGLVEEHLRLEREHSARLADEASAKRWVHLGRESVVNAERELTTLSRELDEARSRLDLLTRLRDEQQNSDPAVCAIVEAARDLGPENPPRLLAVFGQVIRIQKGLETAVEAALEDQLGAVIVPETIDAHAALRILDETHAGRAILVPLRDLKPVHALNLNGERGVLGVASRFVKCDSRFRQLVDTLLGRVIIVEDLHTAQLMLRRGLGTAVTLGGTVVRPTGIITGGVASAGGLLLAHERDLDEMPATIASLRETIRQREHDANVAREQASTAESRLRNLDRSIDSVRNSLRRLMDDGAAVGSAIGALNGESNRLRGIAAAFDQGRSTLTDDLKAADEERRRSAMAVRSAQHLVESARREVERLREPSFMLRGRLAAAIGARQALVQQRFALARMAEGRRAAIERTERTLAARYAELRSRTAEIDTIALQHAAASQELEAATDELSRQRGALQPLREQVASMSQQERDLFALFSARRTLLLGLERASMEAESMVNRRAQAIDRLRDEMDAEGVEHTSEPIPPGDLRGASQTHEAAGDELVSLEGVATTAERSAVAIAEHQSRIRALRARIRSLGPVNGQAVDDYRESLERHEFLTSQVADLEQAEGSLQEALEELRHVVRERFRETFHAVNDDFARYFKTFFGGGTARLVLTEPEDYGESGVDILAQPPGKRQQHLQLLSGGERSMTAVALLFALLETNPAPFCVLDEVDAALDEPNINRFGESLCALSASTQFIVITHNRQTAQSASAIYGISLGADGGSSVLSLRLEDVPADS